MSQQIEWVSHPIFDIEANWTRNYPCPVPAAELKRFQGQIDALTGKTIHNLSRLKVMWGMDPEDTMFFRGRYLRQHPHWRGEKLTTIENPDTGLTEVMSEIIEIGVPRFYVMELHEAAELREGDGWEKARWKWEDGVLHDDLGEIPERGFYTDLFLIAHHDHFCCKGKGVVQNMPCLGAYRPPTEEDLTRIRRILWRKNNARPDEVDGSVELRARRLGDRIQKYEEKRRAEVQDALESSIAPHAHRLLTDDPSVLSNGKYHFLDSSKNKQPKE